MKKKPYKAYRNVTFLFCLNLLLFVFIALVIFCCMKLWVAAIFAAIIDCMFYAQLRSIVLIEKMSSKIIRLEEVLEDDGK